MDLLQILVFSTSLLIPALGQSSNCTSGGVVPCLTFDRQYYNISVNETNFPPGYHMFSPILTTTCYAHNGQLNISYKLIKDGGLPFTINSKTGEITPVENLDYEETTGYTFLAVCTSKENPNITDSVQVFINLIPVNEHRPGTFPTVSYPINCSTTPGPLEGLVHGVAYNVTDRDLPKDKLYFTLRPPSEYFSIDLLTGQIALKKPIVNVTINLYHLRVTVCDVNPADTACRSNLILIRYSYKSFTMRSYSVSVSEAAATGTTLFSMACNLNQDCSGPFTEGVEIVNEANVTDIVSIDGDGRVQNTEPLDYETMGALNFTIRCFIRQTNQPFSLAVVTLNIEDVNEPPLCTNTSLTATLEPGSYQTGHVISQIECSDPDLGANGELSYTVQGELPELGDGQLDLNSSSGLLTYSGNLSSIASASYNIIVQVADSGNNSLVETVQVTLNLTGDSVSTASLAPASSSMPTSPSGTTSSSLSTSSSVPTSLTESSSSSLSTSTKSSSSSLSTSSSEAISSEPTSSNESPSSFLSTSSEAISSEPTSSNESPSSSLSTSYSLSTSSILTSSTEFPSSSLSTVTSSELTSSVPPSSNESTSSSMPLSSSVSTLSQEEGALKSQRVPILVIIVASIAGGILLLCLVILLCLLCLCCYIKRKKANQKKMYLTAKKESVSRLPTVPNIYAETGIQELNLHFTDGSSSSSTSERSSMSGGSNMSTATPSSSSVVVVTDTAIIINESQDQVTISSFVGGKKQDKDHTLVVLENALATHAPDV